MKAARVVTAMACALLVLGSACAKAPSSPAGLPRPQPAPDLPAVALSDADRSAWMQAVKKTVVKPGCCGACARFTMEDARRVWSYVSAPSGAARSRQSARAWRVHGLRIAAQFRELDPDRFTHLYGPWPGGG